eukprot:6488088-Amphidinium_carterae.1
MDFADVNFDADLFHVAFCNTTTFRGHLDRFLDEPVDVSIIAESNHTPEDVKDNRHLPTNGDGFVTFNLAWTHPLRSRGDHHVKGRPSSGLVMAARLPILRLPFETEIVKQLNLAGRMLCRRIEISPSCWLNIFAIYAPTIGWDQDPTHSMEFLSAVMEEILKAPDELNLLVGDFNVPFNEDPISQAVQARGTMIDIGQVLGVDGATQAATYRTRSTATKIDRAMCSPALLRHIAAFTVCTNFGTGAHLPVVISLNKWVDKPLTLLQEVLQIPSPLSPLPAEKVVQWQLQNAGALHHFRDHLDNGDVHSAYFKWATLWEGYLQH